MQLLPPKEVARRLGISIPSLMKLRERADFPKPVSVIGTRIGFVDREVDAWIAGRIAERDAEAAA